jgi:multidrug resistance efflux pump
VAGAGIVEARTRNIAIGAPVPGLVVEVYVEAGDHVQAGQALFKLDDRELAAQLAVRQAEHAAAEAQRQKLLQQPRPEDIPPAQARVQAAELSLADLQSQLALWESVADQRAVSQEELEKRRFAARVAQAKLAEANSELELLLAGPWKPDLDIARAHIVSAQAQVKQTRTDIERLTVRAPVDGQVLQANVRPGEFAAVGPDQTPLMLLGNVDELHVRVDVDENDAWRVKSGAAALASLRGNSQFKTKLMFVRYEPYVVPKRSLTGGSTERVDTRVLQVIYSFKRGDLPVYVGQLMDVFIEAPAVPEPETAAIVQDATSGSGDRP